MILENARLRVEIAAMGAELMHIYDKQNQAELLWNGDPVYWKRRSPVLFPNVGKTYGNTVKINGRQYPTSQHGFARDSLFTCESSDANRACFLLKSSPETLGKYPFDFELRIIYTLLEDALEVTWQVDNRSDAEMPFTIGGHPAFCFAAVDDVKTDYRLFFPGKDALEYILLNPESGTALPDERRSLQLENGCLQLSDELFAHDALIFDGGQIGEVWLCDRSGARRVGMACPGFPNYGVWSVQGAAFVCLEPWMGRADDHGFDLELSQKPNVNRLAPGSRFEKSYRILLP